MPTKVGARANHLRAQLASLRTGPGAAVLPPHITRLHLEFAHKLVGGHHGPRHFWRTHLPRLKFHNPAVPIIVNRSRDQAGTAPVLTVYLKSGGGRGGDGGATSTSPTSEPLQPRLTGAGAGAGAATAATAATATATAAKAAKAATAEGKAGGAAAAGKAGKEGGAAAAASPSPSPSPSPPEPAVQPPPAASKPRRGETGAALASSTVGATPAPPARAGETAVIVNVRNLTADDIWAELVAKTGALVVEPQPEDVVEMEHIAAIEAQREYDRRVQGAIRAELDEEKKMIERARQEADALKAD